MGQFLAESVRKGSPKYGLGVNPASWHRTGPECPYIIEGNASPADEGTYYCALFSGLCVFGKVPICSIREPEGPWCVGLQWSRRQWSWEERCGWRSSWEEALVGSDEEEEKEGSRVDCWQGQELKHLLPEKSNMQRLIMTDPEMAEASAGSMFPNIAEHLFEGRVQLGQVHHFSLWGLGQRA